MPLAFNQLSIGQWLLGDVKRPRKVKSSMSRLGLQLLSKINEAFFTKFEYVFEAFF